MVAAIIASVTALVLHLLHVVDEDVLLTVIMVVLALLTIHQLRSDKEAEQVGTSLAQMGDELRKVSTAVVMPDTILIKPPHLRSETERFGRRARGDMTWFNVCLLMFVPQDLFDRLLRPAVENPAVSTIQFILDDSEMERWEKAVAPKLHECKGSEKVLPPLWRRGLDESVSFILTETEPNDEEEAHLSFWGEPFMAHSARSVPRYILWVQPGSELLVRLREIERAYRLDAPDS